MAYHIVHAGAQVSCDTAEELNALLPSPKDLIAGGPKSRARKVSKPGPRPGTKKVKRHGLKLLWEAARAYAEYNRIKDVRAAYKAICNSPKRLAAAKKLAGQHA